MNFRQTSEKSNKVSEAANNFASCSFSANSTKNNALFSDIAVFAVSVFLFFVIGFICISDFIGIIILNLIALMCIQSGCKFMRKSQSA